jgi:hypothetical protein
MAPNDMLAGSGDDFMAAAKIAKSTGKFDKSLLKAMVLPSKLVFVASPVKRLSRLIALRMRGAVS